MPSSSLARQCSRIAASRAFEVAIVAVIGANAILLCLETYPGVARAAPWLSWLEWAFRVIFFAEIVIRILSHGRRPQDFFKRGWNVFDFVVTVGVLVPGLHGDSAALRVIRIARVVRLVRFSPGLRTIVAALLRSLPGVGGFLALSLVTFYVYGMAGWLIFRDSAPDDYGTIGRAVVTLFVLLSLETLPDLIDQGMQLSPWTLVYYVSYVIVAVNLLMNLLIAVIVNSMEEARRLEMTEAIGTDEDRDGVPDDIDRIMISQRLDDLRSAIADLERELRLDRSGRPLDRSARP
jgi:voltage-gated sodium channel